MIGTHQHGFDLEGRPILYYADPSNCPICLKERIAWLEAQRNGLIAIIRRVHSILDDKWSAERSALERATLTMLFSALPESGAMEVPLAPLE